MLTSEFLTLAIVHFLAVAAPGPDFTVILSETLNRGRKAGIWTAIGIGAGISVHVAYSLLGVSALMLASPQILTVIKLVGAAYLLYLGAQLIFKKSNSEQLNVTGDNENKTHIAKSVMKGFLTNALNPKATLFFLAIMTSIVSTETAMSTKIFYGAWMCSINAAWFILVAIAFSSTAIKDWLWEKTNIYRPFTWVNSLPIFWQAFFIGIIIECQSTQGFYVLFFDSF